jgi:putative phosphoribosyl transferase
VTAEAALRALHEREPDRSIGDLLLAIPVCARDSAVRLGSLAEVVCLYCPEDFRAVGLWYDEFGQTSDDEVLDLLARHASTTTG